MMNITGANRNEPAFQGFHAPTAAIPLDKSSVNKDVVQAVKALNGAEMFGQDNQLMFQRDVHTQRIVLRIVNHKTGEVVAEAPAEYVLRLAEDLKQPEYVVRLAEDLKKRTGL